MLLLSAFESVGEVLLQFYLSLNVVPSVVLLVGFLDGVHPQLVEDEAAANVDGNGVLPDVGEDSLHACRHFLLY